MSNTEREAFEAWRESQGWPFTDPRSGVAWLGWQAHAALAAPTPQAQQAGPVHLTVAEQDAMNKALHRSITKLPTPAQAQPAASPEQVALADKARWLAKELRVASYEAGRFGSKDVSQIAREEWYALIDAIDRLASLPAQPIAGEDAMLKLARFGAAMLRQHRGTQPCEVGDIDGGTAQEDAVACGVIVERTVTEPCGESCVCVEVGDFPMSCYFIPEDVRAALQQHTQEGS